MPRPAPLVCLAVLAALVAPAAHAQDDAGRRASAEGRLVRGMLELSLGNDSTAVRILSQALALAPGDAAVHDALAEAHAARRDWPSALNHAEAAARAAPDEPSVHLRLAQVRASAGLAAEAGRAFADARRLAPARPDVLAAAAEFYGATDQPDAERDALEALVRVGDTPAARLRLADLYAASGDDARARAMLDAALRLAPDEPAIRARRAALDGAPASRAPSLADSDDHPVADGREAPPSDASLDALVARTDADPGDLAAWVRLLGALAAQPAASRDPRAVAIADDARLFFPASPAVLAPAADLYADAGRADDARASARAGLDALDALGDDAPPDADALRARLRRHLTP